MGDVVNLHTQPCGHCGEPTRRDLYACPELGCPICARCVDERRPCPVPPAAGGERLAREPDGRWTLSDRPIHAGALLEIRAGAFWEPVRFEWHHASHAVQPRLVGDGWDRVYGRLAFGSLELRWPARGRFGL